MTSERRDPRLGARGAFTRPVLAIVLLCGMGACGGGATGGSVAGSGGRASGGASGTAGGGTGGFPGAGGAGGGGSGTRAAFGGGAGQGSGGAGTGGGAGATGGGPGGSAGANPGGAGAGGGGPATGGTTMLPLGWSAVTDIGPSLSRSPSAGPSASAISVNGDAFVTFIDFVNRGLWVRRRDPAGDGFDAAVLVDAEGDYDQKIGADGLGNAIAAYGDSTGNILVRRFTRYGGAAGWGDAEVLMPGTQAMKPSLTGLVVTTGGHAVAVGSNDIAQRSSDLATFLTVYEAGRGWTPAVSPFSGLTPLTALASVAQVGSALRVATAASVLDPARANYTTLYGNTYTYDLTSHTGALGGAVALAMPAGTLDDYAGSLLMAGDGTGWLLASQVDTGGTTPAAVLLAPFAGGAWSAAAPFSAAATEDSVLAVAPGGDALAAWFDCGGTQDGTCMLGARRYTGGAWQPDVVVSSGGLSLSGGPWAAVDDQGHAVVVWTDAAASDSPALLAATLDPALGWSAPHTLDDVPYVDLDTGFADVTVGFGPEGTALVSWTVTASVGTKTVRAVFHRFL